MPRALGALLRHGNAEAIQYVVDVFQHHDGVTRFAAAEIGVSEMALWRWRKIPGLKKQLKGVVLTRENWAKKARARAIARRRASRD